MRSVDESRRGASKYAVAEKLLAILAKHSAEEIETAADVVRGHDALREVLQRLASIKRHDESPASPTDAPGNGTQPLPSDPGDVWALRRPSYLNETDMLGMLRTAMADPAVPREALLKLPELWGAKPTRGLEKEKGRPALVLALETLFEEHFPSPRDRIVYGFETLWQLAVLVGRHEGLMRRMRHDLEARLVGNILTYPDARSLAELRKMWADGPLAYDRGDSRQKIAAALVDDLLESGNTSMSVNDRAGRLLDTMRALIARNRDRAKERHGGDG
jgi:hypothetical protein